MEPIKDLSVKELVEISLKTEEQDLSDFSKELTDHEFEEWLNEDDMKGVTPLDQVYTYEERIAMCNKM